jgi:hypothetical protein
MRKYIFLSLLFVLSTSFIYADEEVSFKAEAPKVVRQGQQFRLTFTANTNVDNFDPPEIGDFSVLAGPSTSTSTNVSIINGKMTRNYQLQYTYVLQADKVGKFTIPAAKIKVDGEIYTSNELQIEVIESKSGSSGGTAGPQQQQQSAQTKQVDSDKLFVRVHLSKNNVYRQEPILATVKLYSKVSISNLQNVKFPDFQGFYKEEIETPPPRMTNENVNGEIWGTSVLKKYLLFPQKTGKITIEPFSMECIVQQRVRGQSSSFLDEFFGSGIRQVNMPVKSKPV